MKKCWIILLVLLLAGCEKVYTQYDGEMLKQIEYLESRGCKVDSGSVSSKEMTIFKYNHYHLFIRKGKTRKENLFIGTTLVKMLEGDPISIEKTFNIKP